MVHRAVSFPIPDKILGERLGALVVPARGAELTELELRTFLADKLLDYMVPEHIVFSDTVPLTAIGKLSRNSLAAHFSISTHENSAAAATSRTTPRSNTEKTLLKIVRELLEKPDINLSGDFMGMGGDSFAATVLLVEIEQKFGVRLTPGQFLENSSVEGLSRLIDLPTANQLHPEIDTIQLGDSTPPLFFTHGPYGHPIYSRYFIPHLGASRTIYALQYAELHPIPCMEEYAAHFAQLMRTIYPQGPYLIVGHSFGAHLAFEIAQQLTAAGGEIAFLALIDDEADLFKRKFNSANYPAHAPSTFQTCKRMLDCYTPSLYPGDVDLFIAESPPLERLADPYMGWADIAIGKVSSFEVNGGHVSMMSEGNIALWGQLLAERVEYALNTWPNRKSDFRNRVTALSDIQAQSDIDATIRARRASREGNLKTEIDAYRDAIAENKEQPYWVYRNLGDALKQNGNIDEALIALQQGMLREANPIPGSICLAQFLSETGRHEEALRLLDSIEGTIKEYSINDRVCALKYLSKAWAGLGSSLEAEHCILHALSLKPTDAHSMHILSQALVQQSRLSEALHMVQKAIDIDPNTPEFFIQLGIVQKTKNSLTPAVYAFQRAIELGPRLAGPHRQLSDIYDRQQRKEKALTEARKATELAPANAHFFVWQGILEKRRSDLSAAEHSLQRAIELAPNLARAHRQLSEVYHRQKRKKEAPQELGKAAKLDILTNYQRGYLKALHRIIVNSYQIIRFLIYP